MFKIDTIFKKIRLPAVFIVAFAVATSAFCAVYRVVRVTDGDTIKVIKDEKIVTVRLVGIDAPERGRGKHKAGQPYSTESNEIPRRPRAEQGGHAQRLWCRQIRPHAGRGFRWRHEREP